MGSTSDISSLNELPISLKYKMLYKIVIKPALDIALAIFILLIFSPMLIIIIITLLFINRGHPFFIQKRAGIHGKPINIVKFKTMNDKKDKNGKLLPDVQRLTKFGAFLRKASLDELPQLINVIKGDLSIIGPRPLLIQYLPYYTKEQALRHEVKPGITGWAQVNGRQAISFTDRFELDVWYVKNLSLKFDLKILILTIKNVFKSTGVIEGEGPWKE